MKVLEMQGAAHLRTWFTVLNCASSISDGIWVWGKWITSDESLNKHSREESRKECCECLGINCWQSLRMRLHEPYIRVVSSNFLLLAVLQFRAQYEEVGSWINIKKSQMNFFGFRKRAIQEIDRKKMMLDLTFTKSNWSSFIWKFTIFCSLLRQCHQLVLVAFHYNLKSVTGRLRWKSNWTCWKNSQNYNLKREIQSTA